MPRPRKITRRGPQTPEGIEACRAAVTKHGLFSKQLLLDCENADDLNTLITGLNTNLAPKGDLECLLADRIIDCFWRLARIRRADTSLANLNYDDGHCRSEQMKMPDAIADQQALVYAMTHDSVDKLVRHETTIERQLHKALHELERRQDARVNGRTTVPAVLDVTISDDRDDRLIERAGA